MRILWLTLAMLVAGAGSGCGGGEGPAATTTTSAPPTTVPATTTTVVTAEAFAASICAAGHSIVGAKPGAAGGYRLNVETYGKVVPTPEKKADLDAYLEANRALAVLWSDTSPTTPEAFSEQHNKHTDALLASLGKLQVECPPQPGVTTTVAAAIRAQSRIYSVLRHEKGKGLWWYASFGCPEGKKVKLGADVEPVKGEAGVGAVLDEAAGAAEPFTGVLANESYGRIDEKITATCT